MIARGDMGVTPIAFTNAHQGVVKANSLPE
jgi:hypothetical protein